MAVMAKWRNKTFEISRNKVNPLKNFSTSTKIKGDNSESKKKITELVPFTFDIDVHANAGVNIKNEYEEWCSLIKKTGVLYMNSRRFGRETRLMEVSLSGVLLDDLGRIRFATIGLSFEEVNKGETINKKSSCVTAKASEKAERKQVKRKGKKVAVSVGSMVKLTGTSYVNGKKIKEEEKKRIFKIEKINGSMAYITQVDEWVYINTLSLVT